MRLLLTYIALLFTSAFLFASDSDFSESFFQAANQRDKEELFIQWTLGLSQENPIEFENIIMNRRQYFEEISQEFEFKILIILFNHHFLNESEDIDQLYDFDLKEEDAFLTNILIDCHLQKNCFPDSNTYNQFIKDQSKYTSNLQKAIYHSISTFVEGGDEETVYENFNVAIEYAKKTEIVTLVSSIYDLYSTYSIAKEYYVKAIESQLEAARYAEEHGLISNLINHWINIGDVQLRLGYMDKSELAFNKAKDLAEGSKQYYLLGKLYNNLGVYYNKNQNPTESIKQYRRALLNFYKVNNKEGIAISHKDLGKVYFDIGENELARTNYELSEQFYKGLSKTKDELYYYFSELYLHNKKYALAEKYIHKSINISEASNHYHFLNKVFLLASKIYVEQENYQEANQYLEKYISNKDSLDNLRVNERIMELSELFESEQKERRIIEQDKLIKDELSQRLLLENQLIATKQRSRLIGVSLVFLVLIFIGTYILIRFKNKQLSLEKRQKEMELQQALLRTQMNPHFIFNTMSVIQSFIYNEDIDNASKFLVNFSKLMRLILENSSKEFILLEKEMEINERYLELQKLRFDNRFDYEIVNKVDFPQKISVPPMLVQPFIENAVEHADLGKVPNGMVKITYEIKDDVFVFTIEDNGIGRKESQNRKLLGEKDHKSMAISLTRNRIDLLNDKYKNRGVLTIEDLDKENQVGTRVIVTTPYLSNY